jgi:hypothetical protein
LNYRHAFASSRRNSPELCFVSQPSRPRAQGRPGAGGTRGPLREKHTQKEPHSSIQVKPNTRPSLRSGLTAYAVLSREPSSFWPPSPRELMAQSTRLGSLAPPQELGRSDDGQDHTVLPYAHSLTATEPDGVVHTATGILARRTFSAAHPHEASGSRRAIRPALNLSCRRCRVHRNPARER